MFLWDVCTVSVMSLLSCFVASLIFNFYLFILLFSLGLAFCFAITRTPPKKPSLNLLLSVPFLFPDHSGSVIQEAIVTYRCFFSKTSHIYFNRFPWQWSPEETVWFLGPEHFAHRFMHNMVNVWLAKASSPSISLLTHLRGNGQKDNLVLRYSFIVWCCPFKSWLSEVVHFTTDIFFSLLLNWAWNPSSIPSRLGKSTLPTEPSCVLTKILHWLLCFVKLQCGRPKMNLVPVGPALSS